MQRRRMGGSALGGDRAEFWTRQPLIRRQWALVMRLLLAVPRGTATAAPGGKYPPVSTGLNVKGPG
ncbi:hypothetical protein MN608_08792 [Microdochium nivale]|nr:hypothetical protein MN608_08792 [Microdochium nivale]